MRYRLNIFVFDVNNRVFWFTGWVEFSLFHSTCTPLMNLEWNFLCGILAPVEYWFFGFSSKLREYTYNVLFPFSISFSRAFVRRVWRCRWGGCVERECFWETVFIYTIWPEPVDFSERFVILMEAAESWKCTKVWATWQEESWKLSFQFLELSMKSNFLQIPYSIDDKILWEDRYFSKRLRIFMYRQSFSGVEILSKCWYCHSCMSWDVPER